MGFIQALLVRVWKEEGEKNNEQLVFRCLAVVHTAIIDCPTEPCPALAAILHLVEPNVIPKYVTAILEASKGHSRTLHTLCQWLCCWPHTTRLSPWILALIDGLEAERRFDVLMEVTLATVEYLFAAVMLPVVRSGVVHVVWRMVASSRNSPQVFHKVLYDGNVVVQMMIQG
jgi:ubiquitin carboxyl-terminal hydrolase 35/38